MTRKAPHPALVRLFSHECDACGSTEERVFTDSWTALELCSMCLYKIIEGVTMSPASEGDNLKELLTETTDYEEED